MPPDDLRGGGRNGAVAVISYELWQRRFGGAANVIGMPVIVERVPFTIVGITPPGFFGAEVGRTFDVALPMNTDLLIRGAESRIAPGQMFYGLSVLLRLKPGQTLEAVTALLRGIQPQIRAAALPPTLPPVFQREFLREPFTVVAASTGSSRLRGRFERPLFIILGVVGLVLLIACANLANLQLARAIARRHDLSVHVALGAPRWRLARQSLVESLLLSMAGAALGLLFASWGSRLLVAQLSTTATRVYLDLSLDWHLLVFTAGVAVATTVLFGVLPAVRAAGAAPLEALRESRRGSSTGPRASLSNSLIVAQVTLSMVVVVAAGLLVRSFEKLATLPLGFDSGRLLLVTVNLARTQVDTAGHLALVERLAREVAAVPGAQGVGASLVTPFSVGLVDFVRVPGVPLPSVPMTNGKLGRTAPMATMSRPAGWARTAPRSKPGGISPPAT